MNRGVQIAILVIVVIALIGTGSLFFAQSKTDRETLYQVGSLDDLQNGRLDGNLSVNGLLNHGDIGLGTFNALDGEMIVIAGKCYQARSDGTVAQVPSNELTPFAQVSRFDADGSEQVLGEMNLSMVEKLLQVSLPSQSVFYVLRIDGMFENVTVRSVPKQSTPYPPLPDVIANQSVFNFDKMKGTMVGIWSPPEASGLSSAGFHFHFISDDRTKGGHVLDFKLQNLTAYWDSTSRYEVDLV